MLNYKYKRQTSITRIIVSENLQKHPEQPVRKIHFLRRTQQHDIAKLCWSSFWGI